MIDQLIGNWLCWAIFFLALVCYYQLGLELFTPKTGERNSLLKETNDSHEKDKRDYTSSLISALPLIGLLGTIVGLLDCFAGISSQGASSHLVSEGIANALLTTQLGLVCAIPGWLIQASIRSTPLTLTAATSSKNSASNKTSHIKIQPEFIHHSVLVEQK